MNLKNNKINNKKEGFQWTIDKINLLRKYKKEGKPTKDIALLMKTTGSSIEYGCYKFRIYSDEEARKKRFSEAGTKGVKNKIKKYGLTEATPFLISEIRKLKKKGLPDKDIFQKLSISFSSLRNICHKNKITLDKEVRERRFMEAGIKGGAAFKKKRQDLAKIHSFDENLGYIIGVCFGDGSVIDLGRKGYLELRTVNESFSKAFYNTLLSYTTQKPCYYIYTYNKVFKKENRYYKNVKYHEIFFNNVFFARNLLNIFGSTKNWKININKFLSYGKKFCIAFIRGMFDSDGSFWVDKGRQPLRGNVSFSSTNKQGAVSFHQLLLKLGFDFNLNSNKRKNNKIEYSIRSNKLSTVKKFYKEIGFNVDYKQERLEEFITSRNI